MRKVTIEDISRKTGLSRGTVSRALNDRPDISPRTKQKVLECCQKLNYVPSHAARSLATGRNYVIAALVDDLHSALTGSFLRGVMSRAEQARYVVHVLEVGHELEADRLKALSVERIDGLLNAVPLDASRARQLADTMGKRILVSLWPLEGVTCDVFMPDHLEAGRVAARFLFGKGCADLLYVHRPSGSAGAQRLAGFEEICRERGVDPGGATVVVADLSVLDSFGQRLEQAEAVVASDDFLAVTVMLLCERFGRRPGKDVAVVGQGNELVGRAIYPSLTTVDFGGEEIGRRTMDTFLQRLEQKRMDAPQVTRAAPFLVHRESTQHLDRPEPGNSA